MIKAEVICDSRHPNGQRLTTLRLTYPQIVHADFMTHRTFSRNSSSFRAIPGSRLRRTIRNNLAYPSEWGAANKGMTSSGPMTGWRLKAVQFVWWALAQVVLLGSAMMDRLGAAKQVYNRWVMTPSHMVVLVTSAEAGWANFLALRNHPDADPTIQALASAVKDALNESVPRQLALGEWHCPFRNEWYNRDQSVQPVLEDDLIQSVARCARVSYSTFDNPIRGSSMTEDRALYEKLVGGRPMHASPAEHQAQATLSRAKPSNLGRGWLQYRKTLPGEFVTDLAVELAKP